MSTAPMTSTMLVTSTGEELGGAPAALTFARREGGAAGQKGSKESEANGEPAKRATGGRLGVSAKQMKRDHGSGGIEG